MVLSPTDIKNLPSLPFIDKRLLPNKAAVYFIIQETGEILYIGASVRLKQRWEAHLKARIAEEMGATRVAWMLVPDAMLDQVEALMIRHYLPALNVRRKPRKPPTTPQP